MTSALLERAEARRRRGEDMAISVDLVLRYVGPIDDLLAALDRAGGSVRLVAALRAELARRRGAAR